MFLRHRALVAFLVALIVHLLFFSAIVLFIKKPNERFMQAPKKTISLSQFETPKREDVSPPQHKQQIKQKVKPLPQKSKQIAKATEPKRELNITQVQKQPKEEPVIVQKPVAPKQTTTLAVLNDAFKSVKPIESRGPIKQLYGDEFESMSREQQQFIKDNLGGIGRITEKHLRYPEVAGRLNMQGRSVVEFYLHPNGDISELKLLDSSGYRALDKNSLETIEIAYKDYPRPSQKTKIRIYVHYQLY